MVVRHLKEYDLVILGGGSAAFAAAIRASEIGVKFALIEKGTLGGEPALMWDAFLQNIF